MSPEAACRKWQERLERAQEETRDAIATCDKGESEAKAYFADSDRVLEAVRESMRYSR